jgi:hypothetical protein
MSNVICENEGPRTSRSNKSPDRGRGQVSFPEFQKVSPFYQAPAHDGKQAERFGDVGKDHDCQTNEAQ